MQRFARATFTDRWYRTVMRLALRLVLAALAGLILPSEGLAQAGTALSLEEALARAEQAGFSNRIAAGETRARAAGALAPLRGILPSVRLESGYLRTTDPLGAFGSTLKQRTITAAAFAPASLNDPDATGNLSTGVVIEQPLFNADAWLGRQAAGNASRAAAAAERWTRTTTAVEVFRGYWGAVLAAEQVRTLEVANQAARAHVRQAESMVQRGMATKSDALLAAVKAGEVESALLNARSNARLARRGLALLMGEPADTAFVLPDSLPPADWVRGVAGHPADDSVGQRADVEAATVALKAAEADVRRARSLYLPRLNGFGRLDWNTPGTPFGGKTAWTLGVMLSWSPFAGASELAEHRAAGGRRVSAEAMAEAAVAQAGLELARASDAVDLALARLAIAERAVVQAREAHRIVARKYDGGLATVSELFDAAAAETGSDLAYSAARHDALAALAERRQASGLDLGPLVDGSAVRRLGGS
jgi:outer membrane protein TolC